MAEESDGGTWVHLAPEPHKCAPPVPMWTTQEPPGSVWRCDCGHLWYLDGHRIWARAGFIIKWKIRRNSKKED